MKTRHRTLVRRFILISTIIGVIGASFGYGVLVGAMQFPPYALVQSTYRNHVAGLVMDRTPYETINPVYLETNVSGLIRIDTPSDVTQRRNELYRHIWGASTLPRGTPTVEQSVHDALVDDLENLERIDRLTTVMEHGLTSVSYHFIAREGNGKLVIYHAGSGADFRTDTATIEPLLVEGYDIIAMSMPLNGLNSQPEINDSRFGILQLQHRAHLKFLKNDDANPLQFFITPVITNMNYAATRYDSIAMIGLSGGGWTTTLAAALDPRIDRSYPVAGTLPIYLRSGVANDWGRYQDVLPETDAIATYPELYLLGGIGQGRSQMQVLNQYDSCCFAGIRYQTYEDIVRKRLQAVEEGNFKVLLDDTHEGHQISLYALSAIIEDLEPTP